MRCFDFHCQGESHKATDKVCQDYSYSHIDEKGLAIAVVCDGHGGKRYFRSDVGARFATEITTNNVREFVTNIDEALLIGQPFTQQAAIQTKIDQQDFRKEKPIDVAFRQLFSSIISQWQLRIEQHAATTPLTEKENNQVEEQYRKEFQNGYKLEKIYGCTLMAYVSTPKYWFAFHLGDGKMISFDNDAQWKEPVLWDDRCFLNKTTSICDSDALNEFRYTYQGDGGFPIAVFLGSDGMDDSFGEETNLVNFYVKVAKSLVTNGHDATFADIQETLPVLSKRGSQDDMSVACIYDEDRLKEALPKFILWQIAMTKAEILSVNKKIMDAKDRRSSLELSGSYTEKSRIELRYAQNDIDRGYSEKLQLVKKMDILLKEYHGDAFVPYQDEVGVTEKERVLVWKMEEHPFRVRLVWEEKD
ncbi:MAG: protein phosphatase 2C domain-containing protein [Bacteroidales bacterium]|nr:protein phosphatase 2C domain-containing protein [Bacteroidales bacterium]